MSALKAVFALGRVVSTRRALATVPPEQIALGLARHSSGDWGDVCDEDREANEWALAEGERILSAYVTPGGTRFWIITERDRSATTVLLPEDY